MTLRPVVFALTALVLLTGKPVVAVGGQARAKTARPKLADAAPSVDALVARFVDAVRAKDNYALRRLRVTEDEYRNIILPGGVDEGKPPARFNEQAVQYLWGSLNGKSTYTEAGILRDLGGKAFTVTSVEYRQGKKKYRGFTAYKQTTLHVALESGETDKLKIGSIVELAGQYKFVSYVRN